MSGITVSGDVILFDNKEAGRISPKLWPTLRENFEACLERREPDVDFEKEETVSAITEKGAEQLNELLAEAATAGLLTLEEAQAVVDKIVAEGFEE